MLSLFVALVVISLVTLGYISMRKPRNFPPGPVGIPFLGSIQYLTEYPHLGMLKLAKKYGNVFSIKLFHLNVVCVTGYEGLKEVFVEKSKVFCDRPPTITRFLAEGRIVGIGDASYGPAWSAHRKTFNQTIRELGMKGVESVIKKEAFYMVEELEKASDRPQDSKYIIEFSVVNVVAALTFGERYDYGDERMKRLLFLNSEAFRLYGLADWKVHLVSVYPQLAKIWFPKSAKDLLNVANKILEFCEEEIEKKKKEFDLQHQQNPKDYIEHYLLKMKELSTSNKNYLNLIELKKAVSDLFMAGGETTLTAIRWVLLYMAGYPQIQEKIYREIDQALGSDKEASYEDRSKLPYTEATLHEVLRTSSVIPTGFLKTPIKDTGIQGYSIPKGTLIWINQYSANIQPDQWKTPDSFDPENFLDEEGKFVQNDALSVFGGGIRGCLGSIIAKQEIFLFVVAILQKFLIKTESEGKECDYDSLPGLERTPKPYKLRFITRN